jgi:hypothetical protein
MNQKWGQDGDKMGLPVTPTGKADRKALTKMRRKKE